MPRKTKIICTLGPAVDDQKMMEGLIKAGMNVARFNFSHGDYEEQGARIENFKNARKAVGLPVAMLLDTKGPEIRIGKFATGEAYLKEGDTFTLLNEDVDGDNTKVSVSYKNLYNEVTPGTRILINDGLIEVIVEKIDGKDVVCKVANGGKLSNKKSINIPNSKIQLPSMTDKDKSDILFGIKNGFDYIAASFIRRAEDVINIKKVLKENGGEYIKVISKEKLYRYRKKYYKCYKDDSITDTLVHNGYKVVDTINKYYLYRKETIEVYDDITLSNYLDLSKVIKKSTIPLSKLEFNYSNTCSKTILTIKYQDFKENIDITFDCNDYPKSKVHKGKTKSLTRGIFGILFKTLIYANFVG